MIPITATVNITLGAVTVAPAAPPGTYLGIAHGMIAGVRILADASPTSSLALCLVAAHVLECTLKAYLSRDGSDSAVKTAALRHDIGALWTLAQSNGLPIPQSPPDWVTTLSGLHNKPYYLRYSTGIHGLLMPSAEPMASELAELLTLVQEHCQ